MSFSHQIKGLLLILHASIICATWEGGGIPDVCQITPVHVRQQRDTRLRIRGVSQGYNVYLHISHGVECRLVWS